MRERSFAADTKDQPFDEIILQQGELISDRLNMLRQEQYPPDAQKGLRQFSLAEVAYYLGVTQSTIKKLHLEGKGPEPETSSSGRRSYSAEQMLELRAYLDKHGRPGKRRYVPYRQPGEELHVVSVVNFKGGSGKTTTAAHLAQHLALKGHRVLAIDLDPQASLTALHGIQPELDDVPSLYETLRYDDERKPISEVIRPTNFPNLDIVPASLELQEYEYDTPVALTSSDPHEGRTFFTRISKALSEVDDRYDVVVIDCPPQLGYLTLTALTASSSVIVTVHPQMLDVMSMSQFLLMLGGIMKTIRDAGANMRLKWFRYLVTRFEPTDGPQKQMVGFLQAMFPNQMLSAPVLKSTAISDAGITKQTLYEVERSQFVRTTYDRAVTSLNDVNDEIAELIHKAWGRE
ncbi:MULTISPECIES: plasmid partitioning protein RepA [Rhodobacterales]|jgi:chromosome partitioning protein|uniref:Chromosome partitioning protein ParA n=4 Tax=Rhodobacterales TaxID=204455 RepID=A0A225NGI0_9RHOB|nr:MULTISPECIES: plasmid partitioning protein RepA [Rhodobacterales]OJY32496.1 MAG: plasmid partitioning protein RepA [Rhodobacterales bacterium 65-51]EKE67277.1 putative replication protein A [Celeribacter baekdonensis B30]KZY02822.1 plasmid partitioning protein RepA [Sulfitobacter sp. HI0023]KZY23664.1 plasmid partitioning protein RepA [Sulfitobacter sp. HI0040]KZZ68910.1 plasmid partitioning protein RepA [Sulfitobacter sp. HI0129]|tara:strand:+ start:542 stop:1753 length:1212 start_codon:yes stop_codon:yes gene_type:complete